MPSFSYIARDDRGRIDRGTVEAASAEEVRNTLRMKNLTIEEILEKKTPEPVPLSFTPAMPWTTIEDKKEEKKAEKAMQAEVKSYLPLVETFRLFAGWLLAWYGLVYLLGALTARQRMPVAIPYLEALFTSDLVLRFTFGTFLFLLLTTVHKTLGGGVGKGIAVTVAGVTVFVLFHLNV